MDTDEFENEEFQMAPELQELHVAPNEKDKVNLVEDSWTCILCQEDKQVCIDDENPMVMLGTVWNIDNLDLNCPFLHDESSKNNFWATNKEAFLQ